MGPRRRWGDLAGVASSAQNRASSVFVFRGQHASFVLHPSPGRRRPMAVKDGRFPAHSAPAAL